MTQISIHGASAASPPSGYPHDHLLWWRWAVLVIFPVHLVVAGLTMGLRFEHFLMDGTFITLAWLGPRLRRLSFRCIPMGLTAILYDSAKYWAHLRGEVHIADLYAAEKAWFGIDTVAGRITLPEFFSGHTHPALDLLCGFAYLAYMYEVILLGFYLFFRDEERMGRLVWAFFLVNAMGMATYMIYPAAPPWYVAKYGLGPAVLSAPPSPAGTIRFDRLLGINYFQSFYSRNTNIFGAMPSLHVAYPVLVTCIVAGMGKGWVAGTTLFAILVAFSAVYLEHHWVWDVLFGALYGVAAFGLVKLLALAMRSRARGADPVQAGPHHTHEHSTGEHGDE